MCVDYIRSLSPTCVQWNLDFTNRRILSFYVIPLQIRGVNYMDWIEIFIFQNIHLFLKGKLDRSP